MDSSSTNHAIGPVFHRRVGKVSNGDWDSKPAQVLYSFTLVQVGAGDLHSPAPQYFGQRGHGYAANSHQMRPPSGLDIVMNMIDCHREPPL